MEKTSVASNDYPGIARMTMLQGLRVVTDDLICVETKVETTSEPLTWWQRLRKVIHEVGRDRVRILFADPSFRLPLRAAGRGGSGTAETLPLFFFRHSK